VPKKKLLSTAATNVMQEETEETEEPPKRSKPSADGSQQESSSESQQEPRRQSGPFDFTDSEDVESAANNSVALVGQIQEKAATSPLDTGRRTSHRGWCAALRRRSME